MTFDPKSNNKQSVLFGAKRMPLPTICTYFAHDFVETKSAIASILGLSNPVVSTLTFVKNLNLPFL